MTVRATVVTCVLFCAGAGGLAAQGSPAESDQPLAPVEAAQAVPARVDGAAASDSRALDTYQRLHGYIHDLLGPGTLLSVGIPAGIDHWSRSPGEWGAGDEGLRKRLASSAGQLVAETTVRHGLAAVLGRDPDYEPCGCTGFGRRLRHAALESVTDISPSGHRVLSIPRLAGSYAGAYAPLLWRPGLTARQASLAGTTNLLGAFVGNLIGEYLHAGGPRQRP